MVREIVKVSTRHLLAGVLLLAAATPAYAAEELVVDLSRSVVEITAGFVGSELLLFGATDGEGDLVVIVRGPLRDEIVRRKERVAGIWVNRDELLFTGVPAFYAVASNRPMEEFLPEAVAAKNWIGLENLLLLPHWKQPYAENYDSFRAALIRNKQRQGLYSLQPGNVIFLSSRLFRTRISFPSTVSVGEYGIDVYLVRDGKIVTVDTTLLNVRKVGFEAGVFDFAHRHSLAYGVLAILIAAMAGWLASVMFRKS